MRYLLRRLPIILGFLLIAGFGVALSALRPVPSTDRPIVQGDFDPKKLFKPTLGETIPPDITLRDEEGKAVTMGDFGKETPNKPARPFLVVPVYFGCPMLCNEVLNDLVKVLRAIGAYTAGEDYDVVVVSFDPKEKPPLAKAKKQAYVQEYGRSGGETGWHFLTGEQDQINRLLEAIGYRVEWDRKGNQFGHAAGFVICTPQGRVARYFMGLDYRPLHVRLALGEAGSGYVRVSLMDQVLLPCFNFDPSRGQYSAAVLTIVRAAGVLTVAVLLLFWLGARGLRKPDSPAIENG